MKIKEKTITIGKTFGSDFLTVAGDQQRQIDRYFVKPIDAVIGFPSEMKVGQQLSVSLYKIKSQKDLEWVFRGRSVLQIGADGLMHLFYHYPEFFPRHNGHTDRMSIATMVVQQKKKKLDFLAIGNKGGEDEPVTEGLNYLSMVNGPCFGDYFLVAYQV